MVLTAEIGRFDGVTNKVVFNECDTIQTLLDKANLSVASGEVIKDENDQTMAVDDTAEDGAVYYIVSNFKQGNI